MHRRTLRAISVGALLFVSGLVAAADTTSPDAAAIREARLAQNEALVDHDLDRVATFWTDDVTIRRGLGQHAMGKAEYRKIFEPPADPAARVIYQREPGTIEVSPNWPLAYEEGRWTGRLGARAHPRSSPAATPRSGSSATGDGLSAPRCTSRSPARTPAVGTRPRVSAAPARILLAGRRSP